MNKASTHASINDNENKTKEQRFSKENAREIFTNDKGVLSDRGQRNGRGFQKFSNCLQLQLQHLARELHLAHSLTVTVAFMMHALSKHDTLSTQRTKSFGLPSHNFILALSEMMWLSTSASWLHLVRDGALSACNFFLKDKK